MDLICLVILEEEDCCYQVKSSFMLADLANSQHRLRSKLGHIDRVCLTTLEL